MIIDDYILIYDIMMWSQGSHMISRWSPITLGSGGGADASPARGAGDFWHDVESTRNGGFNGGLMGFHRDLMVV